MEVAGLVVGIIPLTISALEAYQTMCDAIGVIRNHSEAFRSLHVRLRASFFIYRKAVERMLYPLSLSESELEKCGYLDSEKILLLWYTPKEKEKLESCLGAKQCHMYQGLITMFFERIKTLVVDLKLNKECKPLWIGNDGTVDDLRQYKFIGSYSKWRKVRAGLKDRSFQKQLDAIEEDAKRIQYLVDLDLGAAPDQALRKQAAPNTRRQKTESKYLRSITMAATKFYRLLDSWSAFCPNPCGYTHKASLQISEFLGDPHEATQQTAQLQHGEDHSYTSVHLKTLFLLDRIGAQPTWNWKAVDVEPRLQLQPASTITSNLCEPKRRVVQFVDATTTAPQLTTTATTGPHAGQTTSSSLSRIDNLCSSLQKYTVSSNLGGVNASCDLCIGFLEGEDSVHYFYSAEEPECCRSRESGCIISLRDVIHRKSNWTLPLKSLEKTNIAYWLANAVLQYHDTPWLHQNWTTEDVQFIFDGSPSFRFAQPVIAKDFSENTPRKPVDSRASICVKNQAVFSLALALLELTFEKTIAEAREPNDIKETGGVVTVLTDFVTATRLLATVRLRETGNLYMAIKNCIEVTSLLKAPPKSYSLEEDDFRTAFLEGVVHPLREDFELLNPRGKGCTVIV